MQKNNKGFAKLFVVMLAVVFGALAVYFLVGRNISPTVQDIAPTVDGVVKSTDQKVEDDSSTVDGLGWKIYSSDFPVFYNTMWTVEPIMYQSAAAQARGETIIPSGLIFTLKSGAKITWGGNQSACSVSEFPKFVYGTSKVFCVSGLRTDLSAKNITTGLSVEPSQLDKNNFGDFVLKNK